MKDGNDINSEFDSDSDNNDNDNSDCKQYVRLGKVKTKYTKERNEADATQGNH